MKKVYLIAVVVALIAGFATFYFATELDKKTTIKDAETITVLVPVADIAANVKITEDMFNEDEPKFVEKTIITKDANPEVVTEKEQLIDMVTVDPLYASEQINPNRVEPLDGANVALSLKLPKDKVAYSFSAGSVTSVDGYIREGDTVDVIVYEQKDEKGKSEVKYKDLKILRVSNAQDSVTASQSGQPLNAYSTLTVEVTKDEALQLYDIEQNYTYKLILNPRQ